MAQHGGRSSERGQELVEFALLLPLLLLLLFGIIEFGIAVLAYNTISNVGREVARYGVVNPAPNDINTYIDRTVGTDPGVERWTTGINPDALTITYTLSSAEPNPFRTLNVTVTYEYRFITGPVILAVGGNPDLTMQTVTTMYTER
jgi:Flp pilus assembly protein TadG